MQACIKGKQSNGLGELIAYEFYAPLPHLGKEATLQQVEEARNQEIDYSYKHMPSDIDKLLEIWQEKQKLAELEELEREAL